MSLFRAVRSLVGRNKDSNEELLDDSNVSNKSGGNITHDPEFIKKTDKVKGLWTLYSNMSTEPERNSQLQKILPLFSEIYKETEFQTVVETFGERNLKQFTFVIATKLVNDIRNCWKSNLPAESNAKTVLKLLSNTSDEQGYHVICSLDISCRSTNNIDVATDSGIPSTLVKVIQLLLSLPPGADKNKEYAINKLIVLLKNICPYRSVVGELLNTDSLLVLFNLISDSCPIHNIPYKQQVLLIISSIIKVHIDRETVDYFHAKSAIRLQVVNMKNILSNTLPEDYVILAWRTIIEWLKYSSRVSDGLLKEFNSTNGYTLLSETLYWLEELENNTILIPQFLDIITTFVYVGSKELCIPPSTSPYNNPLIESLTPEQIKTTSVRNISAFQILQTHFLESKNTECRMKILDNILSVYASNYLNFLLLQPCHTLSHFIESFESLSFVLKDGILRVLSFVVTVVNYVPFQELSSLSCLLQPKPSPTTVVLIFQIISKLVDFDSKYKQILQEAGLLHMLLTLLKQYHSKLTYLTDENIIYWYKDSRLCSSRETSNIEEGKPSVATYTVAMDCIALLLSNVKENINIFRASGCIQILYSLLYHPDTRTAALRVMTELINYDINQETLGDIDGLIELMQATPNSNFEMKQDILNTFQSCFITNPNSRNSFRESHGFTCIISCLIGLEKIGCTNKQISSNNNEYSDEEIEFKTSVIRTLFRTITAAIISHPVNRLYFKNNIVSTLSTALHISGILSSIKMFDVLDALLSIATENLTTLWEPEKLLIYNPEVLLVILELFPHIQLEVRVAILKRILQIIGLGRRNQEPLCNIGLLNFILNNFQHILQNTNHPLQSLFLSFIEELALHKISPMELRTFFGFFKSENVSPSLIKCLLKIAKQGYSPPFIEMDIQRCGYACLHLHSFGERSYPPANGYTFLSWIYIDTYENLDEKLEIFSFVSDDNRSITQTYIQNGHFFLKTSSKNITEFKYDFQIKKWYHIALVHTRSRFQQSEAKFYVNGELNGNLKSPYIVQSSGNVEAYIGTPPYSKYNVDIIWRIGPCYLIEEIFTWDQILLAYCLGPRYCANFQGSLSCTNYAINNSRVLSIVRKNDPTINFGILDLSKLIIKISEERIIFALNASNISKLKNYKEYISKTNIEPIVDELTTQGLVIRNAVFVSSPYAVLLGGTLPVTSSGIYSGIYQIGGINVMFLLIERAETSEELLDALELFTLLIKENFRIYYQMDKQNAYKTLASFLYTKQSLLNKKILDKIFELVGIIPTKDENYSEPVIINISAFRNLILYYQIWQWTNADIQKLFFRRLNQLLVNNSQSSFNVHRMRRFHVLQKLLVILYDEMLDSSLLDWIGNLIINLVAHELLEDDLKALTSFLVSTLDDGTIKKPPPRRRQRATSLKRGSSIDGQIQKPILSITELPRKVIVRNMVLEIIANLMVKLDSYNLFLKVITPNWIFLFIDRELHHSTITLGLKILTLLLQSKSNFNQKFINYGGFHILEEILPKFSDSTSIYYLLICLFVGKSPADLPVDISSLQLTYSDLFITFKTIEFHILCPQAMNVLTAILKRSCAGNSNVHFTYINTLLNNSIYNSAPKYLNTSIKSTVISNNKLDNFTSLRSSQPIAQRNYNDKDYSDNNNSDTNSGMKLKRWIITDRDADIQKSVIQFIKYLFDNCTEFQELIWNEKKKDLLTSIVNTLFPFESLNYPCNTGLDNNKPKEEEKCHLSAYYLFSLLGHFLIIANSHSGKVVPLFEILFMSPPLNISEDQILLYQTKLVLDFLKHSESSISKQIFHENKTIASNLSKFCIYITDKICAGLLPSISIEFFNFLIKILECIEGLSGCNPDLDERHPKTIPPIIPKSKMKTEIQSIYKSLNRITIYLLYAPYRKTNDEFHKNMQNIIESIIYHQSIVLNLWNNDTEFIFVLCQLLFNFLLDDNKNLREASMNLWKLLLLTKSDIMNDILIYNSGNKSEIIDLRTEGFDLLLKTDFKAFDVFTFWLGDALQSINTVLSEKTGPIWLNYKENENKLREEKIRQLKTKQTQIITKREKKERLIGSNIRSMYSWRSDNISSIQEKTLTKYKTSKQEDIEILKLTKLNWNKSRSQLIRLRGVWGPLNEHKLTKYKLDSTEGPFRMRKKQRKNYKFYNNYPYVTGLLEDQHSLKIPTSYDCKEHYELFGGYTKKHPSSSQINVSTVITENEDNLSLTPHTPKLIRLSEEYSHESDSDQSTTSLYDELSKGELSESEDFIEDPFIFDDYQEYDNNENNDEFNNDDEHEDKIHRLIEQNDKIQSIYNCERIDGMIKRPCLFLICSYNIYIIDDYEYIDGELIDINNLNNNKNNNNNNNISIKHNSRHWTYSEIRDIFKRRYLLRPIALEIFSTDGRNFLVIFELNDCLEVYRNITSKLTKHKRALEDISGNQMGSLLPMNEDKGFGVMQRFWKKDTLTQKWVQGQISNFQYLMHINMLAGRSYNDLTQYPVFPWILSDYESSELNLNDPAIYRDLSKPMGALSPLRAADFQQRYDTWIPRENDGVPKWHYGSHYSSAGTVLYYLIRQEPFTQHFINDLQSGRFDVADRVFHSIKETWLSSSGVTLNMSDVKELIPEFYYLPEFLMNNNKFDLGKRQTGEILDHVILPPWAKNSPLEFIRLHRLALESEYVSKHLHEWIDLIFGYKQQGKLAEQSLNVFYFLTYEGSVDIDAIEDPIEKDSVIAQINNFGQTPKQLFKKPHPQRQVTSPTYPNLLESLQNTQKVESHFIRDFGKPVYYLQMVGEKLIIADKNRICLPTRSYNKFITWGYLDFSIRLSYCDNEETTIKVIENSHDGQISCLCTTIDGNYIITGGMDGLIVIRKMKKTKGNRSFVFQSSLCGNFSPITCIAVSRPFSTFISISKDNTIILWDLNRLCLTRTIIIPPKAMEYTISKVSINNISGNIVIISGIYILLYTINGTLIAIQNTEQYISSFIMSEFTDWTPCDYITGHKTGVIKIWNVERVGNQNKFILKSTLKPSIHPVTCLHISNDGKKLYSADIKGIIHQTQDASVEIRIPFYVN